MCMHQKMWFVETAASEQTSSAIMLWAKTRVYVCSGRAGGNERHLLFYARSEKTWPHPTPPHCGHRRTDTITGIYIAYIIFLLYIVLRNCEVRIYRYDTMIPVWIHYIGIGFLFLCSTWMHVVRLLFMWLHTQRHEHPHRYVCAGVSRSPNFWLASLASSIICWGSWQSVSMAESFADPLVVTASVWRCRGERTASDLLRSFRTLATCL